uniref:Uncharacterized protein n=1 Tax=Candidatus Kentrum sp. UNK TaxID=2126344 RepID=A0A451AZW8_9GAMM|nr:MAG: hypothetical protein BECKUNK1418G_GA0071005_10719 [Candidatus Kentron sp. UNK]VFK71570.1 MAG: hypothetical protein BECKUNK1418H_GA0071006_10729 [Candidatus Kentron sp. UNK]
MLARSNWTEAGWALTYAPIPSETFFGYLEMILDCNKMMMQSKFAPGTGWRSAPRRLTLGHGYGFIGPRRSLASGSLPKTSRASNTGPSTHIRFMAGPFPVVTGTTQPAQAPTPQAMNSSKQT